MRIPVVKSGQLAGNGELAEIEISETGPVSVMITLVDAGATWSLFVRSKQDPAVFFVPEAVGSYNPFVKNESVHVSYYAAPGDVLVVYSHAADAFNYNVVF
jgi:hypothetical protein